MSVINASARGVLVESLEMAVATLNIKLDNKQIEKLIRYLELLIKWNKAFNLTAIREPKEMLVKHLIDSLSIASFISGQRILDVGTGPGLPGIPLAIAFPGKKFDLLDSNGKKTRFLTQSKITLGIDNIDVLHGRVEKIQSSVKYDQILSRAFTALDKMVELCQHLLSNEGTFLAMKGLENKDELASIPGPFRLQKSVQLEVPGCDEQRHLFIIGRSA